MVLRSNTEGKMIRDRVILVLEENVGPGRVTALARRGHVLLAFSKFNTTSAEVARGRLSPTERDAMLITNDVAKWTGSRRGLLEAWLDETHEHFGAVPLFEVIGFEDESAATLALAGRGYGRAPSEAKLLLFKREG